MAQCKRPTPYVRDLLVPMKQYIRGALTIEEYNRRLAAVDVKHGKRLIRDDRAIGEAS